MPRKQKQEDYTEKPPELITFEAIAKTGERFEVRAETAKGAGELVSQEIQGRKLDFPRDFSYFGRVDK